MFRAILLAFVLMLAHLWSCEARFIKKEAHPLKTDSSMLELERMPESTPTVRVPDPLIVGS